MENTELNRGGVGSVPFMITQAQRQKLRDLGYRGEQIREMKPAEAHDILASGKAAPAGRSEPSQTDLEFFQTLWRRKGLSEECIAALSARHVRLAKADEDDETWCVNRVEAEVLDELLPEDETGTAEEGAQPSTAASSEMQAAIAAGMQIMADPGNEPKQTRPQNRFGGLSPSEGATLPPLTYWNDDETLPRSTMGGCVGFLVGQYGSHKTGTAIMLALDAIEREGARVLFIAAEDANGVARTRLPAACKARGKELADIDAHWRTEAETFDLLSETDRVQLIRAYREFAPNLIFIDVLTRVVTADINAPETGMRVMQSAYALAAPFGATVVIAHHPGLSGSGRPMGSSLFTSLADFCLTAKHKDGVVSTYVEKMKNGRAQFTVRYKTELTVLEEDEMGLPTIEAPTVRFMTLAEIEEHNSKRVPKPDVAAENATDGVAIAKLERDAPDVLRALRTITQPMLLREIAPMLDPTADDADAKDEEKGTPFSSRIRRLNRLIGVSKSPGILQPFTAPRVGGKTSPHRLIPITPPPSLEDQLPSENEPSDAPAF
jgi:hypothetical protein